MSPTIAAQRYARHEVYELGWSLATASFQLERLLLAQATLAGPIALLREDRNLLPPALQIFTAAGVFINQYEWTSDPIVAIGWTLDERLVVVIESGSVRLYPLFGDYKQFTLGKDASEYGVLDCRFSITAMAVLTGNFQFIVVNNWQEPRPRNLAISTLDSAPHTWTIISPIYSLSKNVEVIAAVNSSLLLIDQRDSQIKIITQGPFSHITISPNGRYLALFSQLTMKVSILSTDLTKNITELDLKQLHIDHLPNDMTWCGNDAVAIIYNESILLVGLQGDHHTYTLNTPVLALTEYDGIRILSKTKTEIIWKVPAVVDAVFGLLSKHPAKLLYDASEQFEHRLPDAEQTLRIIQESDSSQLVYAYNTCLQAAAHTWEPTLQRGLLKAASFARCFLDQSQYEANEFVNVCKTIRTLNAVRDYKVGMPLTYDEYIRLSPEVLVNRLANRHMHLMGIRIAEYLNLDASSAMMHWAQVKIKKASTVDDDTLTELLMKKLDQIKNISFAEIAKAAYATGRVHLATNLLEHETEPGEQVPLLLSMKQGDLALIKSIQSYDTDLVYLVLLHLKKTLSLGDFLHTINKKPLAIALLEKYALEHEDVQLLKDFYYQDDRRIELGILLLSESTKAEESEQKMAKLREANRVFQEDKSCLFEAKTIDTQMKLLQFQAQTERELTTEVQDTYVGLSLHQTLYKLSASGQHSRASKLKGEFKISDKIFWWIKLRALAQVRDWVELDRLAKSKKSPIGYVAFVDECTAVGAQEEAKKYIAKCELKARFTLYMRVNAYVDAGTVAHQLKDLPSLLEARQQVHTDPVAARVLDGLITQLRGDSK